MGRLLSEPWVIATVIVVALVLFATPKLPAIARSLGQTMRIFRAEVTDLQKDAGDLAAESTALGHDISSLTTPMKSQPAPQKARTDR